MARPRSESGWSGAPADEGVRRLSKRPFENSPQSPVAGVVLGVVVWLMAAGAVTMAIYAIPKSGESPLPW